MTWKRFLNSIVIFALIASLKFQDASAQDVAVQQNDLEKAAEVIANSERGVVSVVKLEELLPPLAKVVETGLLSAGSTKRLSLKIPNRDLSEFRYQDTLKKTQRFGRAEPYYATAFNVVSLQDKQQYEVSGRVERYYDVQIPSGKKQFFREKVHLEQPAALSGTIFLSIRAHEKNTEDFLWYRSAASFAQELTQSNRDDVLLGLGFSLNDLLGFSGKAELLELQSEDTIFEAFVPMLRADAEAEKLKASFLNGCAEVDIVAGNLFPTEVQLVKRRLVKLSMLNEDAFSQVSKRVLYLDADTLQIVMQESYDRSDRLLRTQVLVLQPVLIADKPNLLPAKSLVFNHYDQSAVGILYRNHLFCSAAAALSVIKDFDPVSLFQPKKD